MGTILPMYGYVNPRAGEAPRRGLIERRDVLVESVNRLLAYVSREDVKALKQRVMYDPDFDPATSVWTHAAVYEADPDARPTLDNLLRGIKASGSIVVPTIDDLEYPHSEMSIDCIKRIIADGLPVISMNWMENQESLLLFTEDHVADLRVFEYMWQNAMAVDRHLRAFLLNERRMLQAYNEGVQPDNGVGRPF